MNSVNKHPIQRYHSPSRSFSAAFHALGLASFTYSFYFVVHLRLSCGPRGIEPALQVEKWVRLGCYAFGGRHSHPLLGYWPDFTPCCLSTSPDAPNFRSPPWTLTIIEAAGLGSSIAGGYWLWTEECYRRNGWYPYPLFEMLNTQQRALVFTASAVTFTISSLCLKRLYDLFNGKVKSELKKMI
ncbi:hypothetical protein BGX38DRAFT_483422 [Terfezia claveryi]|nr:hypothetical protein BGX38DRAFT_483422 [Terfezia claveryi]